ncbi:glycosyltransferase family 2 protein, partial [Babjeviella inositovora NRRL Y-12698]
PPTRSQYAFANLFDNQPYEDDDDIDANFLPFPITSDPLPVNTIEDTPGVPRGEYGAEYGEYGPFADMTEPPETQLRRSHTITKKVKMINGNLVLDCPVAPSLLNKYPMTINQEEREFLFMRYQAATCGPLNFIRDRFTLRQNHYKQQRQTEIMIVVTMYNEDDILLARTLKGVFKNIKYLHSREGSSTWGANSWKKIVVCVVSDGRSKINERAQALLAALGVYQEGFAKSKVNDKDVRAHIYEYTTMVGILRVDDTVKLTTEKTTPVQLLFCLKEKNAKKINSHRWCFQAFCPLLNPNVIVLLDAGTQPSGKAIYHLWKEFARDLRVAGACGEIKTSLGSNYKLLLNPLVAAQNFEYKTSNILDKPTESVFGFISVLPGAFSAYRWTALRNDVNDKGPLEKYFKGEFLHGTGGIFTSNMYLAEDRILCYELVARENCLWLLRYVKSAVAETDVPETLAEFILQRRRWLNGSFFAAIYSLFHFPKIWWSSHSFFRQFFLHIEFLYQFVALLVSWFSVGSFFLVFRILTLAIADKAIGFVAGKYLSVVFLWLYVACIVTTFVLSFGNKPQGTQAFYIVIAGFFAVLMVYMIVCIFVLCIHFIKELSSYLTASNKSLSVALFFQIPMLRDLLVSICSTYVLYFVGAFLYFEPWHMFTSFGQYMLLSPAYINILNIYAFCNIDDISWGTKGDTGAKDLGSAKISDSGKLEIDIPTMAEEIDQSYTNQILIIQKPQENPEKVVTRENEDYYAFVRSIAVLAWMFSNFVLIAVVLQTGGLNIFTNTTGTTNATKRALTGADANYPGLFTTDTSSSGIFLAVILWLVFFMAAFRFIGCTLYLIMRV